MTNPSNSSYRENNRAQYDTCPICGEPKTTRSKKCLACTYSRALIEQPADASIRFIPLTRAQVAIVDADDFHRLSAHRWYALWFSNIDGYYAVRWRKDEDGKPCKVYMHREVLGLSEGDPRQADHRFHNTLDNRKIIDGQVNLRIATHAENGKNRRLSSNSTSGFRGVTRSGKKWMALIWIDNKKVYLGTRDTPEAASELYQKAAKENYGNFSGCE